MNVGVVGVGSRGRYLARAFSQRPETNLVAVCDVSEQAIQHAREELGPDVHYYPDLEEMCQREPLQIGVVASDRKSVV